MHDNYLPKGILTSRLYNKSIAFILLLCFLVNVLISIFVTNVYKIFTNSYLDFILHLIAFIILSVTINIRRYFINKLHPNIICTIIIILASIIIYSICLTNYSTTSIIYCLIPIFIMVYSTIMISIIYPIIFLNFRNISLATSLLLSGIILVLSNSKINIPVILNIFLSIFLLIYLGYNLSNAQEKSYTFGNAIISAQNIFCNIINIFITILPIATSIENKTFFVAYNCQTIQFTFYYLFLLAYTSNSTNY